MIRILFLGDVVGRPGRRALARWLPRLRELYRPDLVIANGENLAGGMGFTRETAREVLELGVDLLTMGNHTWRHREAVEFLQREDPPIVRPLNYPPGNPGRGWRALEVPGKGTVLVVNLLGRTFMEGALDCPFRTVDRWLQEVGGRGEGRAILVDVHGEATSEKAALGWHLDGRVSAVVGTHTHVPTADARILPGGTAYLTDVGMVGPLDGVIGMERSQVLGRFLDGMPRRFSVAKGGTWLCGVRLDLDPATGRALDIEPVQIREP